MTALTRKLRLIMELRREGVTDHTVLAAIERTPRDAFLPLTFKARAYENTALPIGHGQTISQPFVVAMMTQALQLNDRMKVLEIGTGSGYQAAVLARLCRRVYTIERHKPLLDESAARFTSLRLHNITAKLGDGHKGWPEQQPFHAILITCATTAIPPVLFDQLAEGGVLVAPVGDIRQPQRLLRYRRQEKEVVREDLGAVRFVPFLPGTVEEQSA